MTDPDKLIEDLIASARPAPSPATDEVVAVLREIIAHVESSECQHESTHRGGAIWTICDDCGMKWADDRGGFAPYVEPAALSRARSLLAKLEVRG